MTAKAHLSRLHDLPCVVCLHMGLPSPREVEAHHLEFVRADWADFAAVPLCAQHHRGKNGVHGLSRRGFEMRYRLDDVDMLAMTIRELQK